MITHFHKTIVDALSYRKLWLYTSTQRSKVRFSRTYLGSAWLGITSVISIGLLAFVYSNVFRVENFDEYIVSLGLGLSLWNGLAAAIGSAPSILQGHSTQILNLNLPLIVHLCEDWWFNVQSFLQSFFVVLLFLAFFDHSLISLSLLTALPHFLNYIVAMLWVPSLLSLIGLRFKDLYQLIPIFLQLFFLLTPILYSKASMGKGSIILFFNPIYQFMAPLRDSLVHGSMNLPAVGYLGLLNILGVLLMVLALHVNRNSIPFDV